MSPHLQERYDDLCDDVEKLANGIAGVRLLILTEDSCVASDLAWIVEFYANYVLDKHPRKRLQSEVAA